MHRLASIGGSITQGMKSTAIYEPNFSYPAIIAHEMGIPGDNFRFPSFRGKGGLPINIEYLLRRLDNAVGKNINLFELPLAAILIREWMDETEDYWERGPGTKPISYAGPFHNLAVWGFELQDSYQVTPEMCEQIISQTKPTDNWFKQIPEHAMLRTARRVLNPTHSQKPKDKKAHQVQRATEMARMEGIENLLINLGANNVLTSVANLEYIESDLGTLREKNPENRKATVYTPEHFEKILDPLIAKVEQMNQGTGRVDKVFWGNITPVTVFPIAYGVGGRMDSDAGLPSPYGDDDTVEWWRRYFKYYTRPWIHDDKFRPDEDPNLTGEQIIKIDYIIAQYNAILEKKVAIHNQKRVNQGKKKDWFIVDFHQLLESLAYRRYYEDPTVNPPRGWTEYQLPPEYEQLKLDTRFLRSSNGQRTQGGLFSLDGVHPTTVGNGLVAQEFIRTMENAGVKFNKRDGKTVRPQDVKVDYKRLIRMDTLIQKLPSTMDDVWNLLVEGDELLDVFKRAFKALTKST